MMNINEVYHRLSTPAKRETNRIPPSFSMKGQYKVINPISLSNSQIFSIMRGHPNKNTPAPPKKRRKGVFPCF